MWLAIQALLRRIPVRDYLYLAAIVALGVYTLHERHVGASKIEAADAKVAAAQVVHNGEVQNVIKAKVAAAVADYDALSPIPVARAVPVLMCHASGSGSVPASGSPASGGDVAGASVPVGAESAGAGFDPAPAVSKTGTAADIEIDHLQKKVKLLQQLVSAYQDGGLVAK
jgi:hypothetical protein